MSGPTEHDMPGPTDRGPAMSSSAPSYTDGDGHGGAPAPSTPAPGSVPPGPMPPGAVASPVPRPSHADAILAGAAYGVLVVLGFVLGVLGGFHAAWTTPSGVPIVSIAAIVVNLVVFWVTGWAMRSKLGSLLPAVAWLIVAMLLSVRKVEGDLIIAGTLAGQLFLVGGSIAAAVAVGLAPAARPDALAAERLAGQRVGAHGPGGHGASAHGSDAYGAGAHGADGHATDPHGPNDDRG